MGWHGMSSVGHLITLMSIFFFYLMFFDSILEKKYYFSKNLGIPRFYKRINYYLFKIYYNQIYDKKFKNTVTYKNYNIIFSQHNYRNF